MHSFLTTGLLWLQLSNEMQLSIMNKVKNGELSIEDALDQARRQLLNQRSLGQEVNTFLETKPFLIHFVGGGDPQNSLPCRTSLSTETCFSTVLWGESGLLWVPHGHITCCVTLPVCRVRLEETGRPLLLKNIVVLIGPLSLLDRFVKKNKTQIWFWSVWLANARCRSWRSVEGGGAGNSQGVSPLCLHVWHFFGGGGISFPWTAGTEALPVQLQCSQARTLQVAEACSSGESHVNGTNHKSQITCLPSVGRMKTKHYVKWLPKWLVCIGTGEQMSVANIIAIHLEVVETFNWNERGQPYEFYKVLTAMCSIVFSLVGGRLTDQRCSLARSLALR